MKNIKKNNFWIGNDYFLEKIVLRLLRSENKIEHIEYFWNELGTTLYLGWSEAISKLVQNIHICDIVPG